MRFKVQRYLKGVLPLVLIVTACQKEARHVVVSAPSSADASAPKDSVAAGGTAASGAKVAGNVTSPSKPLSGTFLCFKTSKAKPAQVSKVRVLLMNQSGCAAQPPQHRISSDLGWKFHPVWGGLKRPTIHSFFSAHHKWFAPLGSGGIDLFLGKISMPQITQQIEPPQINNDLSCVTQSIEVPFQAEQMITSHPVAPGSFLIVVSLEDKSNGILQQGSASVTVEADGTQTVPIVLNDTKTGNPADSVSVVITGSGAPLQVTKDGIETQTSTNPPAMLAFSPTSLTQNINACGALSLYIEDASGNTTAALNAESISLSSSSTGGAFFTDGACTNSTSSTQIAKGGTNVVLYYKDSTAGTPTLTASDDSKSGLTGASASAVINVSSAAQLVFSPSSLIQNVNECGALSLGVQDASNNPAVISAAETASLATNSEGGAFYSDAACSAAITTTQIAAGSSSVVIYYKDTLAGSFALGAIDSVNLGLTAASASALISNYKLVFLGDSLIQNSGSCGALTIASEDIASNPVSPSSAVTINLATSAATGAFYADNACTAQITTTSEAAGSASVMVYYKDAASGTPTLTALEGSGLGWNGASESAQINVVSHLAFTNPPLTGATGACGTLLLQMLTEGGTAINGTADTTIKLSSTNASSGLFYSDAACTTPIAQINIAAGSSSVTIYYSDSTAGLAILGAIEDPAQGWMATSQIATLTGATTKK